jgi:hypothetical protein
MLAAPEWPHSPLRARLLALSAGIVNIFFFFEYIAVVGLIVTAARGVCLLTYLVRLALL